MGLGSAIAHIVGDFAGSSGILAEVGGVFTDETSDATARFFWRASHLGATHHAVLTEALVATIGSREGFAIFVFFAVVFAACTAFALAFVID